MTQRSIIEFIVEQRLFILAVLFIVGLYFFLRLYQLTSLPLFIDEAIYIRWGTLAQTDATQRFISLSDGKQPLFVWIMWPMVKLFSDPVIAGRIVSVLSGFASLVGIFLLTKLLFRNTVIACITSVLYLIVPMTLLYDRLALYDSLVSAVTLWSLSFLVLLVRFVRLDTAILLGYMFGLGLLTKSSIQLIMALSPLTLILSPSFTKKRLIRLGGLFLVSLGVAIFIAQLMKLSPDWHMVHQKNTIFVYSLGELIARPPFAQWVSNGVTLGLWFISYQTFPIFLIGLLSFVLSKKFIREKLFLLAMSLLPLFALMVFGKLIYPRYILFMLVIFLPLAGYGIWSLYTNVKNKLKFAGIMFVTILPSIFTDFHILTDMPRAPIPRADSLQFANSWPSGYGMKEVVEFAKEKSKTETIYLATEGKYGSLPTTVTTLYLQANHEVVRFPLDHPLPNHLPDELMWQAEKHPVYVILNIEQEAPRTWPVRLVTKYQKGKSDYYLRLYQVELPEASENDTIKQ